MTRLNFSCKASARLLNASLLGIGMTLTVASQTRVDVTGQPNGDDFHRNPFVSPPSIVAPLPAILKQAGLFFMTSAPARGNWAAALDSGTPDPAKPGAQSGPLTTGGAMRIQTSGVVVGTRGTLNFEPGTGILTFISDTGSEINVQQTIDSAVVQTRANLQSGQTLLCASASASGTGYTCSMSPTLTAYTMGMMINWKPDQNGAGGATTLNIDTLGAKPIKLSDGTNDPGESDIVKGRLYLLWFDGTSFRKMF